MLTIDGRRLRLSLAVVLMLLVAIGGGVTAGHGAQSHARFTVLDTWAQLPSNMEWGPVSAVAVDGAGGITVLRRRAPFVFALTAEGRFVQSWGREELFAGNGAHGLRVDMEGFIWATDTSSHLVHKLSTDGKILLQVGRKGIAGDNGSRDAFDGPADVAVTSSGDFFVADGYGNSRVVHFTKDGKFIKIIGGTKGTEPGQFDLVHSIAIDSRGRLLIGDRENARVQVYNQDGTFLEQWTGLGRPYGIYLTSDDTLYIGDAAAGTVTIAKNGKAVDVIRGLGRPHSVSVDSHGAIYMADVRGFVKKIIRE